MRLKGSLKREARQQPVAAKVAEHIQRLIRSGELSPGDQLLPERQLAEKLGISRTSVREALAVLAGMGVVEVSPRDGAYIKRRSLEDAIEPLAQILFREQQSIMHMFEVRQIIETQAVRLAALRRDDSDLQRLSELRRQVEEDVRNNNPSDESDTLFHIGIIEAAKNPLLSSITAGLITAMMEVYGPARQRILSNPIEAPKFLREHQAIVEAIAAKDSERAASLMAQHIDHARVRVQAEEG